MAEKQVESILTFDGLSKILENYEAQHQEVRDNELRLEGCKMAIQALIDHEFPPVRVATEAEVAEMENRPA